MVMVMDMATTLERDLLNLTTDTHMPLAHTILLDTELEPHSPPEAHKDSEAKDPLSHTTVMDSTDTVHTDTVQESLDTLVQLPPTLKEAYKELANKSLTTRGLKPTFKTLNANFYLFLLNLLIKTIFVIILIINPIIQYYLLPLSQSMLYLLMTDDPYQLRNET